MRSPHPGTFGLAGAAITAGGRNGLVRLCPALRSAVPRSPAVPHHQVTVDVSGRPFEDVRSDLALAFSRDWAVCCDAGGVVNYAEVVLGGLVDLPGGSFRMGSTLLPRRSADSCRDRALR